MDHRWPGRPELQPDESFASWLARTAAANGLRPGELYRIVQPGEDRNPRDLDRYADDHLLDRLFEAFVTKQNKTANTRHVEDALTAIDAFERGAPGGGGRPPSVPSARPTA